MYSEATGTITPGAKLTAAVLDDGAAYEEYSQLPGQRTPLPGDLS